MAIWKDTIGTLHDDMDGFALSLPLWPSDAVLMTDAEVDAIRNPVPTLAQAQTAQVALIDTAYAAAIQDTVSFTTAAGATAQFQADSVSQNYLLAAYTGYAAVDAVPSGFYWKAADNTQVPFTLADLKGLYSAMLAQGWAAFQKRASLKAEIAAATTVAAVEAIVWQ